MNIYKDCIIAPHNTNERTSVLSHKLQNRLLQLVGSTGGRGSHAHTSHCVLANGSAAKANACRGTKATLRCANDLIGLLVLLGRVRHLQHVMGELVHTLDLPNAVSNDTLLIVVILDLTNDADVDMILSGFLARRDHGGDILVDELLHLDNAGSVLDLVSHGGALLISATDGTDQLYLVKLPPIRQLERSITADGRLGIENHPNGDGDESLLIVGLAGTVVGAVLTARGKSAATVTATASITSLGVETRSCMNGRVQRGNERRDHRMR